MSSAQEPGAGPGPPGDPGQPDGREHSEPVVVRDRRRVKPTGDGEPAGATDPAGAAETAEERPTGRHAAAAEASEAGPGETGPTAAAATGDSTTGAGGEPQPAGGGAPTETGQAETGQAEPEPAEAEPVEAEPVEAEVVEGEVVEAEPTGRPAAADGEPAGEPEQPVGAGLGAELEALRTELDERTRDLQRVTAEYANYRRRAERMRTQAGDEAVANVFRELLPVFDDLERARAHGELSEGVAAVVDQLVGAASKFGFAPFGEQGDPFDPNRHEAVAHQHSAEVDQPTCVEVLRRGYLLGDRLLRPAMVAVADPEAD